MKRLSSFAFGDVQVHRLVTGPVQENAYLVVGSDQRAVLIDPGDDAQDLLELIRQTNARLEAILLTHAHFDHIGAVQAIREALEVLVYLHPDATSQYIQADLAAARWNLPFRQPQPADRELLPGTLGVAGLEFQVLFTPGHAPGHISLYSSAGFVLSGDALFQGSIGRTDLPGCDHELLMVSITSELLSLPPTTIVFSGHGMETTIGHEATTNPFLS
jgi:glyoxylase-like metal-dependent hydrolase (beta-lactamase superfamily II)